MKKTHLLLSTVGGEAVPFGSSWELGFGTDKVLTIDFVTSTVANNDVTYNNFSSAGSTSAALDTRNVDILVIKGSDPTRHTFTMNFSLSGTGLATNEKITEIGFAALNRNNSSDNYTVTPPSTMLRPSFCPIFLHKALSTPTTRTSASKRARVATSPR